MWHELIFGLLLGYGAAVPIGPMNLELIRRNLLYGFATGLSFGLGACFVDATYMVLLGLGARVILNNPLFLQGVGLCGALILFWFAYKAATSKVENIHLQGHPAKLKPWWRHFLDSYCMTLVNPFTIIFWSSVSSEAALVIAAHPRAFWVLAPSVLLATFSWVLGLNTVLHCTRHKISPATMRIFNLLGAILLASFAAFGLYRIFV